MNKQRICIVGDGLSGLMTAISLNQVPGIEVKLVAKKESNKQQLKIILKLFFLTLFLLSNPIPRIKS